ncbi:MAG: hypothetical protein AAFX06_29705 [Planctomycetota bacterium]
MNWFQEVFGFTESEQAVRDNIEVDGERLYSRANGRRFNHGRLSTPTLAELREQADAASLPGKLTVQEIVADVRTLHREPENTGALFQVASQFNLLEMISPRATPSDGITRYFADHTQGPACAMACAAGTLYRNWFAQTTNNQIDCLADLEREINAGEQLWSMENGYALLSGLAFNAAETSPIIRIGIHANTEVTDATAPHCVTQAYCSALPISYSGVSDRDVEPLARMVLNSAYEATFAAAIINACSAGGSRKLFLTLLGGGAFGNPIEWIIDAIERSIRLYKSTALDVAIVSYGSNEPAVDRLLR